MQEGKESRQKIEQSHSKLMLAGLAYGAIFGALAWVVMCELWLNQAPPRQNVGIIAELIVGGLAGAFLGFIIGLGTGLYQYPSRSFRSRQR